MTEEWKQVEDFPAYEVSNLGRLRRLIRRGTALERYKYFRGEKMKLGYIRFAFPGNVRRLHWSASDWDGSQPQEH